MKKKKRFDDDIFNDPFIDGIFGSFLKRQMEIIKKLSESMFKDLEEMGKLDDDIERFVRSPNAKVYGISIKIGPDGKPIVKEFGNIKPTIEGAEKGEKELIGAMEPLTEVVELDKDIRIIAELPGVKEDTIEVKCEDDRHIIIKAGRGENRYYKEIKLPKPCKKRIKKTYKNGLLEIIVPKK